MSEAPREWYDGVPVTATRTLSDAERSGLAWMRRDAMKQLAKAAAFFVFMASLLVALIVAEEATPLLWIALGILVIRYLRATRNFYALALFVRHSKRDLADGIVAICTAEGIRLEVLPASHLLWSRNGTRDERIVLLGYGQTAAIPEHARMAANYLRPYDESTSVHQRPLSEGERNELAGYVPPFPMARVVVAAMLLLLVILTLPFAARLHPSLLLAVLLLAALAVPVTRSALGAIRWRRELRADLADPIAVIVRTEADQRVREVLPHALLLWTEDGEPAAWRRAAD